METYSPSIQAQVQKQIEADIHRFMMWRFMPAAGFVLGVLFVMAIW